MYSWKNFVFALTAATVAVGFSIGAQADTIFVGWKNFSNSKLLAYDLDSKAALWAAPVNFSGRFEGNAYYNGNVYVSHGMASPTISVWSASDGSLVNSTYCTNQGTNSPLEMCFNSAGVMYATYPTNNGYLCTIPAGGGNKSTYGYYAGSYQGTQVLIYNNYIYAGDGNTSSSTAGGVMRWPVGANPPVTAEWYALGSGTYGRAVGFCFLPDGTLWTSSYTPTLEIRHWYTTPPNFNSSATISLASNMTKQIGHMEYWKGYVYVACSDNSNVSYINRYNLATRQWETWLTSPYATSGYYPYFTIIPEPSTLLLLASGLLGLLCYAWRKQK